VIDLHEFLLVIEGISPCFGAAENIAHKAQKMKKAAICDIGTKNIPVWESDEENCHGMFG
jgi:hypothetical protein